MTTDDLERHLAIVDTEWDYSLFEGTDISTAVPSGDAHRRFIDRFDRPKSRYRAEAMHRALDDVRLVAVSGGRLDFERLCAIQAIVLKEPAPSFRRAPAFAKGGDERYGFDSDTERRFKERLDRAHDDSTRPVDAALRCYLDISFFHPFSDGNARAARLALDFFLTRSGHTLKTAAPLFVGPIPAGSAHAYRSFARIARAVIRKAGDHPSGRLSHMNRHHFR